MNFEWFNMTSQMEHGGWILLLTVLLAFAAYREALALSLVLKRRRQHLHDGRTDIYRIQWETDILPKFERRLKFVSTLVKAAPLMGLLGTVLGLLKTFRVQAQGHGHSMDLITSGVSQALITTEMGLMAAIPGLWMVYFLRRRLFWHRCQWQLHGKEEDHVQ